MLIDESRFFWKALITKTQSFMNFYHSVRPLVFLPFNIWLYCVTLPFRLFMSISSGNFWNFVDEMKNKSMEFKDKTMELKSNLMGMKEDIKEEFSQSQIALQKSEIIIPSRSTRRSSISLEDRQHGWFAVERDDSKTHDDQTLIRRKSPSKKQKESPAIEESSELKSRISEYEQRVQSAAEDKQRLEEQLKELTEKFNNDEAALANFDKEKRRFRSLINVEQKKCFDFQQQIISLKSQLSREHESLEKAESTIDTMKKDQKRSKKAAKKSKSETSVPVQSAQPAVDQPEETHSMWHESSKKLSYTEMVAEAQREELESGKKFSEVLKDALKKEEPVMEKSAAPEFTVIGGPQSSQHIVEDIRAPVAAV